MKLTPAEQTRLKRIKQGLGSALLAAPSNMILRDMEWLIFLIEKCAEEAP